MHAHRQLLRQQLVKFHAPPGRVRAVLQILLRYVRRWMVQKRYRVTECRQLVLFEQSIGQGVFEFFGRQRAHDQFAQGVLPHARRGRVHRRQRLGDGRALLHHAVARMHHLRAEKPVTNFAECADACPGLEVLHLAAVETEKSQCDYAAAIFEMHHQLPARTILDVGLDHGGFDQHLARRRRILDRIQMRFIVVAQRQMQHQIEFARDVEFRQFV